MVFGMFSDLVVNDVKISNISTRSGEITSWYLGFHHKAPQRLVDSKRRLESFAPSCWVNLELLLCGNSE